MSAQCREEPVFPYLGEGRTINLCNSGYLPVRSANGGVGGRSSEEKACELRWCACFPSSCLSVRRDECSSSDERVSEEDRRFVDSEYRKIEEAAAWRESFDKLLRSSAGRKVFGEFLRTEYSEENLLFWLACEELKQEESGQAVEDKARAIYDNYISILSPKEVSLDSRVRDIVNSNMVNPSRRTFDDAQMQIYMLMYRDSYPRFLNSALFQRLCGNSQSKAV